MSEKVIEYRVCTSDGRWGGWQPAPVSLSYRSGLIQGNATYAQIKFGDGSINEYRVRPENPENKEPRDVALDVIRAFMLSLISQLDKQFVYKPNNADQAGIFRDIRRAILDTLKSFEKEE